MAPHINSDTEAFLAEQCSVMINILGCFRILSQYSINYFEIVINGTVEYYLKYW